MPGIPFKKILQAVVNRFVKDNIAVCDKNTERFGWFLFGLFGLVLIFADTPDRPSIKYKELSEVPPPATP